MSYSSDLHPQNWDDSEDECLCRAWIKAVEQHKAPEHKSAEFWRIVTELFQKTTPRDEERSGIVIDCDDLSP